MKALIFNLIEVAEIATERQLKEAMGTSSVVVAAEKELGGEEAGDLLLEVGSWDSGEGGSKEGHGVTRRTPLSLCPTTQRG